ncbi:MAG: GNAT family N-acetyltransferase [Bacteroidota bacterium]
MSNKRLGDFFRSYSRDTVELKMLRFCFLRISGIAAAVQIGIEYANRFWLLKIGFNEAFARCSPGIILMNEVIGYAFFKKLNAVEFLGSNEEWLHIWTNHFHEISNYRIYNSYLSCLFDLSRTYPSRLINKLFSISAKRVNRISEVSHA